VSNLLGLVLFILCWDVLGKPALGTPSGDLLLVGMATQVAGYLNLLPCFRSDGIHLLAHIRAARSVA
jgi:hypothetical protein